MLYIASFSIQATNSQLENHLQTMVKSCQFLDQDEQGRMQKVVGNYATNVDTLNKSLVCKYDFNICIISQVSRDQKIDSLQEQLAHLTGRLSQASQTADASAAAKSSVDRV